MAEPLVSVLMNCYNGEKYLREAIDSVLAQNYQNWEIIFWDNQSTDGSAEIFKSYTDPRFKYFRAPNHTDLYEARNRALEKASGEFIAFLDVDDWWLPDKLRKQIPLFSDPEVGIVCGNYWIVSERKKRRWKAFKRPVPTGRVLDELLKVYYVGLLTLVVRRAALDSLEYPCNPRYHMIGDLDLVARLATKWKLACEQEPVGFYRAHSSNASFKQRNRHIGELERWLQEMKDVEAVGSRPGFQHLAHHCQYQKAVQRLLEADRLGAFRLARSIPWGELKARLWLALLIPGFLARRLKN